MLTERSPKQNVSPTPISLGLNALFQEANIKQAITEFSSKHLQTLMWENAPEIPILSSEPTQASVEQQVESASYPESDYQWLVEVLEALTDIVSRNSDRNFDDLTETDYEQLDAVLKELIYVVGDDEKHPLASLMDFIGVLITEYEDAHFPKLTDMLPELTENITTNGTKIEDEKENFTMEVSEKSTNTLAAEAFFSIGNLLLEGNKREESVLAYHQSIRLKSDSAETYYYRGEAKYSLGKYESAAADFDEAIRINPADPYAYLKLANVKCALSQYEAAIADFDKVIQLNSDEVCVYFAYLIRGCINRVMGQYKNAIADFDESIQLKPDNAVVYFMRGCARYQLDQYELAIVDFNKTIRLKPDFAQAYNNRGHLKNKLGQYESALVDCNESIRLNFEDAWPYANRGFAKIKLGQIESALTDCDEAIRRNPSLAEAYHTRGEANALLGKTQEAEVDFQEALKLAEKAGNQDLKIEIEQSLEKFADSE